MPRPIKCRRVAFIPGTTYFKPAGIPLRMLEEICLSLEEAEAIRLKDIEDLDQEQSAQKMNISRPTFQRVLESARRKIADALLNGKAIKIDGGTFEMATEQLRCARGHKWSTNKENILNESEQKCPVCNTASSLRPTVGRCHNKEHGRMRRGRISSANMCLRTSLNDENR